MLIQKGGIIRDIDENRLHEYMAKGYALVENKTIATASIDINKPKGLTNKKTAKG